MTPHPGHATALLSTAWLAALAGAQTATVSVTHNHPTGLLAPGQTVQLSVSLTWTGAFQLGRIAGDAEATPDVGTAGMGAGNVGLGPLINFGAPAGGSIRGVDIASGPPGTFIINPLFIQQPVRFLTYEWTAPTTPGVVLFDWQSSSVVPQAQLYLTSSSFNLTPANTTYLGTSITVIPAPASAMTLALAGLAMGTGRRRRDSL